LSGVVHVFPNGTINTLANMTKDWSAYVLDVGVAYKEDTDHVIDIMRKVAGDMQAEPTYRSAMLEPIEIFGVDAFTDSAVTIKARFKTRPLQQYMIGREYRRRLKKAFDAAGIEIPFPQRALTMGQASSPFQLVIKETEADSARSN
ncbi:MAG TPA: mechanosensitive ion channel family protein, partial [Candidatus Udaeobacter sp.]|nr:mechanosensitive ion channel family protein [Candidatus Udaeobacter sp.]